MRNTLSLPLLVLITFAGPVSALEGRLKADVYYSPGRVFQVDVPIMRNPFVKKPDAIRDERRPDDGEEVTFSVLDLGEAWRYGVMPLSANMTANPMVLSEIGDQLLISWLDTPSKPNMVHEEQIQLKDGSGILRIYEQEEASLLYKKTGSTTIKDVALIGVIVAISEPRNLILYVVGQFDMPLDMLKFHVEIRKVPREKVMRRFATEHAKTMRELTTSFRLQ